MAIVNGTALESNKNFRVSFDGGNLSSDGGLLLLMEFYYKLGVDSLMNNSGLLNLSAAFTTRLPEPPARGTCRRLR